MRTFRERRPTRGFLLENIGMKTLGDVTYEVIGDITSASWTLIVSGEIGSPAGRKRTDGTEKDGKHRSTTVTPGQQRTLENGR